MAVHALWAAALAVSVLTGRNYADTVLAEFGGIGGQCDDVFANGDNGPFGYGQNAAVANRILLLLIVGAFASIGLAAWSVRLRLVRLAVVNIVIGSVGAVIAAASTAGQFEANPYCQREGWHGVATFAGVLILLAGAANVAMSRGQEST